MSARLGDLKWRFYYGEEADGASSEDEDYFPGGKKEGYTRDELAERKAKKEDIQNFENVRFKDYKNLTILRPPHHKGVKPKSVRPRAGSEVEVVFRTYKTEAPEKLEVDDDLGLAAVNKVGTQPERAIFHVGGENDVDSEITRVWLPALESYAVRLRRGEVAASDWIEGQRLEVELFNVRDERDLRPRRSPWQPRGCVRKKRYAPPRVAPPVRPTWGDVAHVRVARLTSSDADLETAALESLKVTVGAGEHPEGLESGIMAMKPDELALITVTGDFTKTEAEALQNEDDDDETLLFLVRLDDVKKTETKPPNEELVDEATKAKERGKALFLAGQPRRAEALWTRALRLLDLCELQKDDKFRAVVEEDLVVPLFLNLGQCARKRSCPTDEEVLITKALVVKRSQEDPEFRGKAYVRRAAARIDQGRWAAAKDDLRAATDAAKDLKTAGIRNDIRRQLQRIKDLRAKQHQDDKKTSATGFLTDVTELPQEKKKPLLYEKEINDRLKAQKPWDHDPDYDKTQHAPRKPLDPPEELKEPDLESEYKKMDDADAEDEKFSNMARQNWVMSNMYDTHGTGRRGMRPKGGGSGEQFMSL